MEPMDLIKNPLYWRGVAAAEFAVATDASYSVFLSWMIEKIES